MYTLCLPLTDVTSQRVKIYTVILSLNMTAAAQGTAMNLVSAIAQPHHVPIENALNGNSWEIVCLVLIGWSCVNRQT